MRKIMAVLVVVGLVRGANAADMGYWPENPTPKITTFAELKRYEKARKASIGVAVLGTVAAGVLLTYAGQVDRKANRVNIYGPGVITAPGLPPSYFARLEQVEFQRRLRNKADLHQTIGIVMALASVLGFSLSMSLRF